MTSQSPTEALNPAIVQEAERQYAILSEGLEEIYPKEGLLQRLKLALKENRPLRVKLGADPTAPDIHLGHAVLLNKLRQFQDLGHKVQFLIGGYTALIGDPSGRNKTRPPLTEEEIKKNAETYMDQVFKILDNTPERIELLNNATWLSHLSFADTIKLAAQVTVAQIIQREDFAKRLSTNTPISLHELLYPLMQGYDSVEMACDIEIGGTDQTFNCLMGRQLMEGRNMLPQVVLTLPLLEGLDGVEKMSKSKGNYVGLTDAPHDMFGKIMSLPDELMPKYFMLLTNVAATDIPSHPMEAKKLLGRTIVTRFHDEAAALAAQNDFETRFSKNDIPDDLEEKVVESQSGAIGLLNLLVQIGFCASNGEARRAVVNDKSVRINQERVEDPAHQLSAGLAPFVLQVGKRKMARITVK